MGFCDDGSGGCASATGCHTRKDSQTQLIEAAIRRVYPSRKWGEIDDRARVGAGVSESAGRRLAEAAGRVLQAQAYFCQGGEDELCDYIYLLCVGRPPSILDVRRGAAQAEGEKLEERYLRVALSSLVRAATLQEVQMTLRRREGTCIVQEVTRDGVYDPVLMRRTQKMVDLLARSGITYLDFGMVSETIPAAFDFGDYTDRYAAPPTAVTLLFYPQPPVVTSTVLLDAAVS